MLYGFFQIKAYVVKAGELMLRIEMILNCTFELNYLIMSSYEL